MTTDPLMQFNMQTTPQTQQADKAQVQNNAGGFSFEVSTDQRLLRFLILGTWGGTYYVSEQKLTKDSFENVKKLVDIDGKKVVDMVLDVSLNNRAYKQNPTLFTLAVASAADDVETRRYALAAVEKVCRTGTMFFQFLAYTEQFRGWGSALQKAAANWYTNKTPDQLANQLVKYRQRDGWTHRDVLRLAKPKIAADNPITPAIRWTVGKDTDPILLPELIYGFQEAQKVTNAKEWVKLIEQYKLPWEALPTQALNEPLVWEALAPHMGLTALIRNLGKMSACGALVNHSDLSKIVNGRLSDKEAYLKARVHPMQVLLAQSVYSAGRGFKGNNTWNPVATVVDNLNEGFYAAFGNLPETGKRRMLAIDVSGSMGMGTIANTFLTPRDASAALAMVALHQDPESYTFGFSGGFIPLGLSKGMRLDSVIKKVNGLPFDRTDCALPMVHAKKDQLKVDSFEIYTDNETWAGKIHPHQALKDYRAWSGINSKFVVNGMVANNFTVADPKDPGSIDVVGFDASTPSMVSDFICQ